MKPSSDKKTSVFPHGHINRSNWKRVKLGDVLSYEQPYPYIVKDTEYADAGIPVLTPGKTFILGYTHEATGVCQASYQAPKILFDDFLTISRLVEFDFKVKSSAVKILSPTSNEYNLRYLFYAMSQLRFEVVDHQRHWIGQFAKLEIAIPSRKEQDKISDALVSCEKHITAIQDLITKYEAIKKATVNLFLSSKPDVRHVKLTEVAFLSTETIKTCVIDKQWYIGTENMLANCGGVEKNNAPIQYPRVRSYCQGDILISNIRPYLKKIWLADRNGGCSTDVNVIRCKSNDLQFDYLYFVLSQDRFFEYVMSNAVGTKMPRGDKAVIGDFEFPLPTIEEQTRVVHALKEQDAMISNAKCQLVKLEHLKQGMMTYFFG